MSTILGPAPAPENVTREPRRLHMEVLDPRTGDVWLLQEPVTSAEFKAMAVGPPFIKVGLGSAAMDEAQFSRSPGSPAPGPVETRVIGGRRFARVARVQGIPRIAKGDAPTLVQVEKHHRLGFAAGRSVLVARLPDGQCYVEQTEAMPGRGFVPPAGWQMLSVALQKPWSFELPSPANVYFFASLKSFIGPLDETGIRALGL